MILAIKSAQEYKCVVIISKTLRVYILFKSSFKLKLLELKLQTKSDEKIKLSHLIVRIFKLFTELYESYDFYL